MFFVYSYIHTLKQVLQAMAFREKPNYSQKGRPVNADKERRIALKR
jgi:hypothetical protein